MTGMNREFLDKAQSLGHNEAALCAGKMEIQYFTVPSIVELRGLVSMATTEQKELRQASFFNPPVAIRQKLGQGVHDRGEAYAFAHGSLSQSDLEGINRHFPAHIKAISIGEKTLHKNEVWDITATADIWGIHESDEIYMILNVGRLIIEEGAKLIVKGNIFSFLCQQLIVKNTKNHEDEDYQIGILPTPFSVDFKNGPLNGCDGEAGLSGKNGKNGITPYTENSILGKILINSVSQEDMNGTDGCDGTNGYDGANGRNGGMCRIAEITIRHLEGKMTLFVQAGKGGDGGRGGDGGDGGNGGTGSAECKHLKGILCEGSGGNGGQGGSGGNGGNGGNGGIGSNIYINIPKFSEKCVKVIAIPSEGGNGGMAGNGGKGGRGGDNGFDGVDGNSGKSGRKGKARFAPFVFINENYVK